MIRPIPMLVALAAAIATQTTVAAQNPLADALTAANAQMASLSAECARLPDSPSKRQCERSCYAYSLQTKINPSRVRPYHVEYVTEGLLPACRKLYEQAKNPPASEVAAEAAEAKQEAELRNVLAEHLSSYLQAFSPSAMSRERGGPLLSSGSLDWDAYKNGERMAAVFIGRFRDGDRGQILGFFRGFLGEFSDTCTSYLPPDAIRVVSRLDNVTTDGLGREVDRKRGVENEITMARRFVDAYKSADPQSTAVAGLVDIVAKGGNPLDFLTTATTWIDDTRRFFEVEPCQGQPMLQMGENLLRLVEGRRPLQEEADPARILTSLEVAVDPELDRRDVEVKQERAAAFWRARQGEWSPPQVEFNLQPGWSVVKVTYAGVPPGYEIPVLRPVPAAVEIEVSNPGSGGIASVSLQSHPYVHASSHHLPGHLREIYERDLSAILAERGVILRCMYHLPGAAGMPLREYWYEQRPISADPAKLRQSSSDHPLLDIGGPRSTCPASVPAA